MDNIFSFIFLMTISLNTIKFSTSQSILLGGVQVSWYRYRIGADQTNFTVQSALNKDVDPKDAWVGVGLSDFKDLDRTHFFICRNSPSLKWIRHYVVAGNNQVLLFDTGNQTLGLSNPFVIVNSDILRCTFTIDNKRAYFNDVNYTFAYVIVAFGSANPTTIDSNKAISNDKQNFYLRYEDETSTSTTTRSTTTTTGSRTTTTTTTTTRTTTTTTRPTTTRPCIDFNATLCDFYVNSFSGECQSYSYIDGVALTTFCCKSCNCIDFQANCNFWADKCDQLVSFNPHPCRKTCKVCV